LAVPLGYIFPASAANAASGAIQVTVNGVASFPIDLASSYVNPGLFSLVLNASGSVNSSANPTAVGSTITVFLNGLSNSFSSDPPDLELAAADGWSVMNVVQANPFLVQVDLRVPSTIPHDSDCSPLTGVCFVLFQIYAINPSGPGNASGETLGGTVSLTR
jgi:uncharacterized protein (TIGR03437 family)